ncbi:MAG: histidinol dehydrogenase [Verrucomicrobia bacterium]|nr:MAG: histidinol dehydrogenase [Verrucomicrobiota bacterium]
MQILSVTDFSRFDRRYQPSADVAQTVGEVIDAVRRRGDAALLEFTAKFDRARFSSPRDLVVQPAEFEAAQVRVEAEVRAAIRASLENVTAFAERSKRRDWTSTNAQGAEVGEVFQPFDRVGMYVPGGTAPLVSTVNMTVGIARAAGCRSIVVCTPPGPDGSINPAMLHALQAAGATEVWKLGGAQAIAALALGTETLRPVQKIFGPGNAYVMEAKRQVFGAVAVDLLPGPSEVLVLADDSANPAWIAADLLAQAEHGGDSVAILVSDSQRVLDEVVTEIEHQASSLSRQAPLRAVLEKNCTLVKVESMEEGVNLTNAFAPEHLSLVSRRESELLPLIRTAGAIFVGPYSPVAAGDFLCGPSHELPTGGACKGFAGLTVDQFQRRTSIVRLNREALALSLPVIEAFARIEGLDAHGRSASIRLS